MVCGRPEHITNTFRWDRKPLLSRGYFVYINIDIVYRYTTAILAWNIHTPLQSHYHTHSESNAYTLLMLHIHRAPWHTAHTGSSYAYVRKVSSYTSAYIHTYVYMLNVSACACMKVFRVCSIHSHFIHILHVNIQYVYIYMYIKCSISWRLEMQINDRNI